MSETMIQLLSLFAALLAQLQPAPAAAPEAARGPVVVELFTSQGCAMCPDANAVLEEIGARADVIALAYGVSYWDMYGWEDEFARPEFMDRQQAYVDAGEAMRVYTPHFVINGSPEKMRFSAERIRGAVDAAAGAPAPLEVSDGTLRLDGPARDAPAQIWRVDYQPGSVSRRIEGGANAGRAMTHYNMATALAPLGEWTGGAMTLALEPPADGEASAILVQDGPGGRILAAALVD